MRALLMVYDDQNHEDDDKRDDGGYGSGQGPEQEGAWRLASRVVPREWGEYLLVTGCPSLDRDQKYSVRSACLDASKETNQTDEELGGDIESQRNVYKVEPSIFNELPSTISHGALASTDASILLRLPTTHVRPLVGQVFYKASRRIATTEHTYRQPEFRTTGDEYNIVPAA
jgi:hypothetical protein